VTEPVGGSSNTTHPQFHIDQASSATSPPSPPRPTSLPVSSPGLATQQLVSANSLVPKISPECVDRAADLAKGAGGLAAAAGALIASGTAGPVGLFIGASMIFGAVLAQYHNCEVDAAARRAKAK
jgi:hypothetical protein